MEHQTKSHYGYTINLSPNKYFQKIQWKDFSISQQKLMLQLLIQGGTEQIGGLFYSDHEYIFEQCKSGLYHVHGRIYTDHESIYRFQSHIHKLAGLPRLSPDIVCKITKTTHDSQHWLKYMKKHQQDQDSPDDYPTVSLDVFKKKN